MTRPKPIPVPSAVEKAARAYARAFAAYSTLLTEVKAIERREWVKCDGCGRTHHKSEQGSYWRRQALDKADKKQRAAEATLRRHIITHMAAP